MTQTMIERFNIEYYIDGTDPTEPVISINAPATMRIIPNLMKGTTYEVRVQAVNNAGPSEYSTPVTARTDIDRKSIYLCLSYFVVMATSMLCYDLLKVSMYKLIHNLLMYCTIFRNASCVLYIESY